MAVAVDLSKTFDSINHNLLLEKLKAHGLSQSALCLMSSYPLGCKQRVCLHGVCSSYSELRAGLPLGSLLRPPHLGELCVLYPWMLCYQYTSLSFYLI